MANIFISYQRSDTLLLAYCLRYALRAGDHDPFVDTGAIPAGTAFAPFIDDAIARSDLVVVLIGPSFDYGRLNQPNSVIAFEWRRARFHGCAVLPVLYQCSQLPAEQLPNELRWLPGLNARFVSDQSLSADVDGIVTLIPELAHAPRPSARVLWVDDNPKNNVVERRYLRTLGLTFDNVVSTEEAVEQLRNSSYDLVITDLGRLTIDETSYSAGLDAVQWVVRAGGPPVIVYAGRNAIERRDEVIRLGGFGSTNSPDELYALIDQALGRTLPPNGMDLER
jgi:CheY-like chemotaxis protein